MDEKKLNIAIVGLGKMGLLHTSILNVLPNVKLVTLCEKSSLIRRLFKRIFKKLPILEDIEKLSDYDLDVVYVTTPIPSHFSVARTVYAKNIAKNLFVEKTLAANYEEAKELCNLAERSHGVNMVGYLRRFYVTFRKAKGLLENGSIGELSSFKSYAFSADFVEGKDRAQGSNDRGGVLSDLGCYALDLARWFFGDLDLESANADAPAQGGALEEVVKLELRQSARGRLSGVCDISWHMKDYRMPEVGFSIEGSRGSLDVNDDKVELKLRNGESARWYRHDLNDNVPFWLAAPEYFREDEYFVQCVLKSCKAEPCFESASKVDKLIDEVKGKLR